MPLYEYHCDDCQADFTLLQSLSTNKDETTCEHCGSSAVKPQLSSCVGKVQGVPRKGVKPATADDYPDKEIFKLPRPRHISEY
ncbi:MAG: zinc ribbon domain-containing protein [Candidatus Nitronauta litoralis]|uniref:Zinc ribbon domain-containing protein n=1 Tax=Candidatus Nitronauta litoralis TaxID=2705533 RepID=A0A7T0BVY9_9BACT|nr:MAG: zinc ribbon domain-containing protein [Candidatus Nitronauta litoralis]